MRDCSVITTAVEEESPDNTVKCIYKEVVIVGNGPSAITLSYLLSGHRPYYNRIPHPDPMLSARLIECTQKSLLHQDLQFLSQGIEGRSKNPVSLLIDAMSHPGADMGLEWPSLLTWKKTTKSLDHVVIGKGEPGGIWHAIADNILTISPGRWMALPGLEFKEYHDKRATASEVAKYYLEYVKKNDLTNYMVSHSSVSMIQPLPSKSRKKARWKVWVTDANGSTVSYECLHLVLATGSSDKAGCLGVAGESLPFVNHDLKCFEEQLSRGNKEEASSFYISESESVSPVKINRNETRMPPFNFQKKENDYPSTLFILNNDVASESETGLGKFSDVEKSSKSEENRLSNIDQDFYSIKLRDKSERKSFENVFTEENDIWYPNDIPGDKELELSLNELDINNREFVSLNSWYGDLRENRKTVLVVGAGLSAADAILTAWSKNYSVVHAFRSPFISSQLPATMYPEYHELYNLMRGLISRKDYKPLPGHQVTEIHKDNTVQLTDSSGNDKLLKVYSVAILIGSQPDLFFLPESLKNLGVDPNKPVDCKANPIHIEPFSYRCVKAPPGMYALGPLVGDNFVRFLQGGAIAIASHMFKDNSLHRAPRAH